ncbi:MAG: DUF4339 domain-containing protein [Polyangiales bacterium]
MGLTSNQLEADEDRAAIWNVIDHAGERIASRVSRTQLRARFEHGLLPRDAKVSREGDSSWFPIHELVSPAMWWVARASQVVGPVDGDRVRRGILAQKIPSDALVCRQGEQSWRRIAEVDAFASFIEEVKFDGELTMVTEESDVRSKPPPPPSHPPRRR